MIIGLTGKMGAGKGEVCEFLKARGFQYYSLSDVIREEIRSEGKSVTREDLIETGNRLRKKYGSGVLAERLLVRLDPDKNYVIDSIRHPEEVAALRRRRDFQLLHVKADDRVRFERVARRAREKDPMTVETFIAMEKRELGGGEDTSAQQLEATAVLCDFEIENDETIEKFHQALSLLLPKIAVRVGRPSWDDYFLGIAKMVAMRSNCLKRRVAAIIVKDQRIISTGYNGTPRGVANCSEGGCPRCASFGSTGERLEECLCSHAEENAITQAAYHGVNIKGSVLYSTYSPCLICTKMIINSGIQEVVYNMDYTIEKTPQRLLEEAGIKIRRLRC